ncbi:MAG: PglZ domain [Algoriphagus marincola HL-49]|uniref:PglZ domain n=1 Tax=Algoriphagus marincola HL-49 TaxID=1305737 RepID=A0A0P8C010_9BACT|nr:MAG: PglZ domain [Algoriphagus marincola HL-49]
MLWQDAIHTALSLDNGQPKVISDHTGVLLHDSFTSYLQAHSISFQLCHTVADMLPLSNKPEPRLILTSIEKVPAFICNDRECKSFHFKDLPINGDAYRALKQYSTEQVIQLLEVVYLSDRHTPINQSNIDALLAKANRLQSEKQFNVLLEQLNQLTTEEPGIISLTEASALIGQLNYLSYINGKEISQEVYVKVDQWSRPFFVQNGMEQVFYASTPKRPLSVDKIIPHLKANKHEKVALLCLDCMGFTEWNLLKAHLELGESAWDEKAVFAMLPSVTSISRLAIYEGKREVYNHKAPGRPAEAKALAENFAPQHTTYLTESDTITSDKLLGYDVVSILYNFFDELAHAVQFPPGVEDKTPYLNAAKDYLQKSSIKRDIQLLKEEGYTVYLCSDHGSIVAKGNGKRIEKYLIDGFAKRAVIIQTNNSELLDMEQINIPFENDKKVVLPEGRTMFTYKDKIEVNHGGITLEEMIVPFIKLN